MASQGAERPSDSADAPTGAVTLPDGAHVPIRPIRPDDAAALQAFHRDLSRQSVYLRFFATRPELADDQARYSRARTVGTASRSSRSTPPHRTRSSAWSGTTGCRARIGRNMRQWSPTDGRGAASA